MLLNQIDKTGKRCSAAQHRGSDFAMQRRSLGCGNLAGLRFGMMRGVGMTCRMGASSGTFPGAGAQRILDDLVDSAGAAAAFGAATQAAVDLPCRARQIGRSADRAADVIIAQNIAGTDDQDCLPGDVAYSLVKAQARGKAKRFNFKIFQTAVVKAGAIWNKSKQAMTKRAYRFNSGLNISSARA